MGSITLARAAIISLLAVAVVVAGAGVVLLASNLSAPVSPGQATSNPTACSITGQGGIAMRVVSDSSGAPLAGVSVVADNVPYGCGGGPATSATSTSFVTNGTEWRSLPGENNYQYHVTVTYSGRSYSFSATIKPVSLTCATISLPSGKTDITTTEFGTSCASIQG